MTIAEILAQVSLFTSLPPEDLDWVASRCRHRACAPGDRIYFAGDRGHHLYFLGSGKVKIHHSGETGADQVYCHVSPGEFFGEMSVIDGEPRTASATCAEVGEIASLNREGFFECLNRFPDVNRRLLETMCRRLRNVDPHLELMATQDVYGRVAKQLLELARIHGVETERGPEIRLHLAQEDLADLVGVSPESIGWVMSYYEHCGYLLRTDSRILIIQPDALLKRAIRELKP